MDIYTYIITSAAVIIILVIALIRQKRLADSFSDYWLLKEIVAGMSEEQLKMYTATHRAIDTRKGKIKHAMRIRTEG